MTGTRSHRSVPDRARRRAIRALATQLGVPYSVAARLLSGPATPGSATPGPPNRRFPVDGDEHRAWMFAAREHRSYLSRVRDAQQAGDLPLGRAAHLTRRFPPLRTAAGDFYLGDGRETALAMLYAVLVHESPRLIPARDELGWAAELGEEAAVDIACAALDRAARLLLDPPTWRLWPRIEAALTAGEAGSDRAFRDAARLLNRELRSTSLRGALPGVRQILDALLVEPYDGLPPGTRTRNGIVSGVRWSENGPPLDYDTLAPA
jgi:hypothetical protein